MHLFHGLSRKLEYIGPLEKSLADPLRDAAPRQIFDTPRQLIDPGVAHA